MSDPAKLAQELDALSEKLRVAKQAVNARFIGQDRVVTQTMTALLAGGHAILVGVPGLGKTRLVDTMATVMGLSMSRVQFTPDLMPSDILGSEILDQDQDGKRQFRFLKGPIFCQMLMADEINRASPRTQSALLQAMQERQVSIAGQTFDLGMPFHVLATQNPIEQEGTYPLPRHSLIVFCCKSRWIIPTLKQSVISFWRPPALTKKTAPKFLMQPIYYRRSVWWRRCPLDKS